MRRCQKGENKVPRRVVSKTFVSATAFAVAFGIAAPPIAPAHEVYAPSASVPSIIGLQIAQDEGEAALAPQKNNINPSEEIKKAVESATGSRSEDKGDGANPSEEIKKAVESATSKVKGGAAAVDDDDQDEDDDDEDKDKKKKKKDKKKKKGKKDKKKGKKTKKGKKNK